MTSVSSSAFLLSFQSVESVEASGDHCVEWRRWHCHNSQVVERGRWDDNCQHIFFCELEFKGFLVHVAKAEGHMKDFYI